MPSSTKLQDERLQLWLTPKAKTMLKRAASAEEKSLSALVVDKGLEAATEILADRCSFVLSARHYDAVIAGLDTAQQSLSRLERLFAGSSVLE